MRYAQGGGLNDGRRAFREGLRLEAAEWFQQGDENAVIAHGLRMSVRSGQRWHTVWSTGGARALALKGPVSLPLLSDELFAVLEHELGKGAGGARLAGPGLDAVPDQGPDRTLVPQELHGAGSGGVAQTARLDLPGSRSPCGRGGRGPGGRLGEGDLAPGGRTAAALGAWLAFEDEAGFSLTPPVSGTWSRRGHTPVVRVRGRSRRRISVVALACYKPGEHSRLIYRPCPDARPDGRKSLSWQDCRDLIQTAHAQPGGPIVGAGQPQHPPHGGDAPGHRRP